MQRAGHTRRRATIPAKRLLTALTAIVMVTGALASANIAQADQVQVQSYERASQTATCDSPPESLREWRDSWANPYDPISGPAWHPTWEQWANGGTGGWTCTRSIVWARSEVFTYRLGDIGPGGGLIFLIADGLTYEMAPKNWGGDPTDPDPLAESCEVRTDVTGATGTSIGTGATNTAAMVAACASGASNDAAAYRGGGLTDWFLPSKDELNAMCNYSRNPAASGMGVCTGALDGTFASGAFGFTGLGPDITDETSRFWSSSQFATESAWVQVLSTPFQGAVFKQPSKSRVRPIRAF